MRKIKEFCEIISSFNNSFWYSRCTSCILMAKIQNILLVGFFYVYKFIYVFKKTPKKSFLIGTIEVAGNIYNYKKMFSENSISVCLENNKYFKSLTYDIELFSKSRMKRFILSPILLASLIHKVDTFIIFGQKSFCLDLDFEYSFLKKRNKKIILIFVGNDIRSLKLLKEVSKKNNEDTFANYYLQSNIDSDKYDILKKYTAQLADKYADLIFNAKYDQVSYLQKKAYFPHFSISEDKFHKNYKKFQNLEKIKILHAPSNTLFKATPLVRAAIKKLSLERNDFEYVEMMNVSNEKVLKELETTHIVLNQFYSFVPGLFGVEAMANMCTVLMSADSNIETGLENYNNAWLVTKYWEIYDNINFLLNNKNKLVYYAENGYKYALKNHSEYAVQTKLIEIFKKEKIL
ncbi:hypothetical protein [Halarcobacter sp.]|uniref:hypothetical protein n=1 Tax=Halarcobacter sp. TaxID=2321133 RepID=UPI002AAA75BB|nr:hypothetical protein [Halarcobacter sp.]